MEDNLIEASERFRVLRDATPAIRKATATKRLTASLPRSTSLPMLLAMQWLGKHLYMGTVDPVVIEQRRKANKRARAQRRVNRARNFRKGVR